MTEEIKDINFFRDNAYGPSLWEDSWEYMHEKGILIHKTPETIPYKEFPSFISRFKWSKDLSVIAPKPEWNSVLIPFEPQYFDEKYFNGHLISDIIFPLIQGMGSNKKFIASARPSCCFFAEMATFDYEIFSRIYGTNLDKPFFLFDETLSYCFGFEFDLEYSFFSSSLLQYDDKRLMGTFAEWDAFFIENFVKIVSKDSAHMEVFETILRPSISRVFSV